jgi:hypothetical protein
MFSKREILNRLNSCIDLRELRNYITKITRMCLCESSSIFLELLNPLQKKRKDLLKLCKLNEGKIYIAHNHKVNNKL